MEVLDPNDIEVLDENDFEVVEPQALPERIVSNIAQTAQSVQPVLESGGELSQGLLEDTLDTSRGVGQGLVMGAADEIGGALSALGESAYNKFNPTDADLRAQGFQIEQPGLTDLYRQNQQAIQKEFETSQERSPVLYTGGQLAGGVTSGSAIGGALGIGKATPGATKLLDIARNEGKLKALGELGLRGAKTYKEALPIMLAEGALSSQKGGLTSPEERGQLAEDVAGSALFGLPAVMGIQTLGDVAAPLAKQSFGKFQKAGQEIVQDSPLLRQMKVAFNYGTEGINPKAQANTLNTELGKTGLTELDNTRTKDLMKEIYGADQRIGKAVGQSLADATNKGTLVNIAPDTKDALSQVMSLADRYPEITANPRAKDIFAKISQTNAQITPVEAKDLIDYMDAYIGKFKSATNKTPLEEGILGNLYTARKQFSNTLKTQVPEYGAAAERMASFRNLVPETLLAGNRPVEIKDQYFGNLNNQDEKLFDSLKKLVQGTTKEGSATQPVRESFVQSMKGLKTFEQQEAERLAAGYIKESALKRPVSEIEAQIKKYSDDAVARGAMDALDPHTGVKNTIGGLITGAGDTGRSMSLSGANLAGRLQTKVSASASKNPVAKMSRAIYNAPNETVTALAGSLKAQPGLEKYGNQLEQALQSTDQNKKNQVLFTIMQNPSARAFVGEQSEEPQE